MMNGRHVRIWFGVAVVGASLFLSGCQSTQKESTAQIKSVNFASVAPVVPTDIRINAKRKAEPPRMVNGVIPASEIADGTNRLLESEDQKTQYILRLMRIIDTTHALLSKPLTVEDLQKRLDKAQPSQ